MNQIRKIRNLLSVSSLLAVSAACSAQAHSVERARQVAGIAVGEEFQPCDTCPTFVRVPDAPENLRPIRLVAKYELTWNNYIGSIDDGVCPSLRKAYYGDTDPQDIGPHIENLRIDWPIAHLGVDEIDCYSDWLESQIPYDVELPTAQEWEWFARGENREANFPWGDNPLDGQEALFGRPIAYEDKFPGLQFEAGGRFVAGVRVGLFQPNSWGLHDIMGNLREVTSDITDGGVFAEANPESNFALATAEFDRVTIKGFSIYEEDWQVGNLSRQRTTLIVSGQYSSDLAVRLVLIRREAQ